MDDFFSAIFPLVMGGAAVLLTVMLAVGVGQLFSWLIDWDANRKKEESVVVWLDKLYVDKHIAEKPFMLPTGYEAAVVMEKMTTPKSVVWLRVRTLDGEKYIKKKYFVKQYREVDEDIEAYSDLKRIIKQRI